MQLEHFQSPCSGVQCCTRNISSHDLFVFPEMAVVLNLVPCHIQATSSFDSLLKQSAELCQLQVEVYFMWGHLRKYFTLKSRLGQGYYMYSQALTLIMMSYLYYTHIK